MGRKLKLLSAGLINYIINQEVANRMDYSGKSILLTGGTGSFGKAFIGYMLKTHPSIEKIVIYSRDELKQFEMHEDYTEAERSKLRFFLGDVRDKDRLVFALDSIDIVIHAAALKQVPAAEYNPFEFVKTNILGAQNVIEACLSSSVTHVVALSTDKAASPVNLYGATKLTSDKLFTAANNYKGAKNIRFSVVRYGNVMGSRGSVIPFFRKRMNQGVIPITDAKMTRFNITLQDSVQLVLRALENAVGGEIFVPKIPSYRILDLKEAVAPDCKVDLVGIRPGEKLHEEMISEHDSPYTLDLGDCYVITPSSDSAVYEEYIRETAAVRIPDGFVYSSGNNDKFLTVTELRDLISKHLPN